jgi:hypothetical protein
MRQAHAQHIWIHGVVRTAFCMVLDEYSKSRVTLYFGKPDCSKNAEMSNAELRLSAIGGRLPHARAYR